MWHNMRVMTYPLKFRKKVFAVKEKYDLTFTETSERFDLPMRTLFRWQACLEPKLTRHKPATKVDMESLQEDVKKYPDAYLWERAKRLKVSVSGVFYALKRLNISYKKNTRSSKG